ncbi:MAG: alpha/beta hydrolase [Spirochaetes bacterium]|nr:alpha/beta hydrolase [Spirochaetota bacterium]
MRPDHHLPFAAITRIVVAIFISLAALLLSSACVLLPRHAIEDEIQNSLQPSPSVLVEPGRDLVFSPLPPTGRGFILYPGAQVVPSAYAVVGRALAELGYHTYILKMPFNLAVLDSNAATAIIRDNPQITEWLIGGHSLGGAMAADYVYKNPQAVDGLVLFAAWPVPDHSLADRDLPMLSVYGQLDGLATVAEIDESRSRLPPHTKYVQIDGGNHAQFGSYGLQKGDLAATINKEEQFRLIKAALQAFINDNYPLEGKNP